MPEWFFLHYERLALDGVYRHDWHTYVLQELKHRRWIASPNWKVHRKVMLAYQPYCERCGERDHRLLEIDHKDGDYTYMGIELLHPECLQVLCQKCHNCVTVARKMQPSLPLEYDANEAAMLYAAHAEKVDRMMNGRR